MRVAAAGVLAVACVVAVCAWTAGQRGVVLDQVRCNTTPRKQRPPKFDCQRRRGEEGGILAMACHMAMVG